MGKLNFSYRKVAWLLENVPETRRNYKLLILLYWQVFDNVDIPRATINEIVEKGTKPETISRYRRMALERHSDLEAIRNVIKEAAKDE